jgi:uncharacterized protein DUF3105
MASRKEQKERLRQERLRREAEAAAATQRRRFMGYAAAGVLAVAAVAAIVVVAFAGGGGDGAGGTHGKFPSGSVPKQRTTNLQKAAQLAGCELKSFPIEGRTHVTGTVKYKTNPPTSGNHNPVPAEDGAYTEAPGTEHLVHSLEHGRIIVQFKPTVPAKVKGDLKALFDEDPYHMFLTPNETGMPYEVAATGWGQLLGCRKMDDRVFDAIRAFRDSFRDRGPEFRP